MKLIGGAKTFDAVIKKLKSGRCNTFIARYEPLKGAIIFGKDYLGDGTIGFGEIPDTKPDEFLMLISRKFEHAKELKKIIDDGIAKARQNGTIEKLLKKYGQ